MRRTITPLAGLVALLTMLAPASARAQAPPVTGTCVENCGGGNGNSGARERQLARNHAQHAKEERWFNEVKRRWDDAVKKGNGYYRDGQKALAKGGQCAAAVQDFQRELAAFSVDLTPAGQIIDARLGGQYYLIITAQQQSIKHAQNSLTAASTSCFAPVAIAPVAPAPLVAPARVAVAPVAPAPPVVRNTVPRPAAPVAPTVKNNAAVALSAPLTRIGAAAAIRGNVYMLLEDGTKVPVHSGSTIYFNSRIVTGDGGHMQVLLLDETVFTLGPNSDMVLDDFVYDPNTSAGKLAANLVKGTFRFVSGVVRHTQPDNVKVKLPVGSLGIRGTEFEVQYEPGVDGYIALAKGALEVTPNVGTPFPMKPGDRAVIKADGTIVPPDGAARGTAEVPATTEQASVTPSAPPTTDAGATSPRFIGKNAATPFTLAELRLLREACDGGNSADCRVAGGMLGGQVGASLLQRGCDGEDGAACISLAQCYRGQGCAGVAPTDAAKAAALFQRGITLADRACNQGAADDCLEMGYVYEGRANAAPDLPKAARAYERACDGGNATACFALGAMLEAGRNLTGDGTGRAAPGGIARDGVKAISFFQRACDGGESLACNYLGTLYEKGAWVIADRQKARDLYARGCALGYKADCTAAIPNASATPRKSTDAIAPTGGSRP